MNKQRTLKQSAELVQQTIKEISGHLRTVKNIAERDIIIEAVCLKNKINSAHIKRVGLWEGKRIL